MTAHYKSQLDAFIETVKTANATPTDPAFITAFLSSFPLIEMESFTPAEASEIAGLAYAHLNQPFAGEPLIAIGRNPSRNRPYVMLLNHDMPYLVDSITAALRHFGHLNI